MRTKLLNEHDKFNLEISPLNDNCEIFHLCKRDSIRSSSFIVDGYKFLSSLQIYLNFDSRRYGTQEYRQDFSYNFVYSMKNLLNRMMEIERFSFRSSSNIIRSLLLQINFPRYGI